MSFRVMIEFETLADAERFVNEVNADGQVTVGCELYREDDRIADFLPAQIVEAE